MTNFEPIFRDANHRTSPERRAAGKSVWSADVDDHQLEVASLEIRMDVPHILFAAALRPVGGDVLVRDRIYVVDGRPVCWAQSFFDPGLVSGTAIAQRNTGPGGTPARLAELGYEPVSFVEDVAVRGPAEVTAEERRKLQLGDDAVVVRIVRMNAAANGRVVEVTDMRLVADAYWFRWSWGEPRDWSPGKPF